MPIPDQMLQYFRDNHQLNEWHLALYMLMYEASEGGIKPFIMRSADLVKRFSLPGTSQKPQEGRWRYRKRRFRQLGLLEVVSRDAENVPTYRLIVTPPAIPEKKPKSKKRRRGRRMTGNQSTTESVKRSPHGATGACSLVFVPEKMDWGGAVRNGTKEAG